MQQVALMLCSKKAWCTNVHTVIEPNLPTPLLHSCPRCRMQCSTLTRMQHTCGVACTKYSKKQRPLLPKLDVRLVIQNRDKLWRCVLGDALRNPRIHSTEFNASCTALPRSGFELMHACPLSNLLTRAFAESLLVAVQPSREELHIQWNSSS